MAILSPGRSAARQGSRWIRAFSDIRRGASGSTLATMTQIPDFRGDRCLPSAGSLVDLNGATVDLQADSAATRFSSGAPPVPAQLESSCVLRDRYVVERQLAQGGKGTV